MLVKIGIPPTGCSLIETRQAQGQFFEKKNSFLITFRGECIPNFMFGQMVRITHTNGPTDILAKIQIPHTPSFDEFYKAIKKLCSKPRQ